MRASIAIYVLAICLAATPRAEAQVSFQKGYLKASVAELDEPDRSAVLDLLAQCRKVSDVMAKALIDHNASKVSQMATQQAAKQWREVAETLKTRRQQTPSTTLQYRNQAMEFVGARETVTSRVWYAVVSSASAQPTSFVSVVVDADEGQAGRVLAIETAEYVIGVPDFLQQVDAPASPPTRSAPPG